MKIAKIIVMGNVVADVVACAVDEVPRFASLHPESITFHSGGCATNPAIGLARLGVEAQLVACVGQDLFGNALLEILQAGAVDTRYVQRLGGQATGVSIVLVDSNGERRFIANPGANNSLTPAALPPAALDGAFALHIGGFFVTQGLEDGTLASLLKLAQTKGVLTSLDPISGSIRERREALFPLLPYLDLLLLNDDEGQEITDQKEPHAIAEALLAHDVRTVIVKQGARGSLVMGQHGPLTVPAYPAHTIDGTGAGDAFAAALLASLARGDQFAEAVRWASAAGAANVEALGATGKWRGWEDLANVRKRSSRASLL